MTKQGALRELAKRGVTKAVVHFSGGNDEGGADLIEFYGPTGAAPLKFETQWDHKEGSTDFELAQALEQPASDHWGSYAGEFSVDGTITWYVVADEADDKNAGEVVMAYSESVEHYEGHEETV